MDGLFNLTIRTPVGADEALQPKAALDINPRVTDLRYTITIEGGYQGLECGMSSAGYWPVVGEIPTQVDIDLSDDVVLRYNDDIVWEGRVAELRHGEGGIVTGFTAEGYMAALSDGWSESTSTTTITSGSILEYAIKLAAPYLNIGTSEQWVDPLVQHASYTVVFGVIRGGLRDIWKMTAGEAVNMVLKEGNSQQDKLAFMILGGRTVWLIPLVIPEDGPDYRTPFDARRMTWVEHRRDMAHKVTVEYQYTINDDDQTLTINVTSTGETSGFRRRWGFERSVIIPIGESTPDVAAAYRDRELVRRSVPTIQSTLMVTDDPATWLTHHGAPWPWHAVMPGTWIEIANRQPLPVVAVTVDVTGRSATYELGERDPLLPSNMFLADRVKLGVFGRFLDVSAGRRNR